LAWHHYPGSFIPIAVCYQKDNLTPQMLHLVTDHQGTPREAVTNDGQVVWAAQLQTWGNINQKWWPLGNSKSDISGASGAGYNPIAANDPGFDLDLRFANQWEDKETGLFYNYQRYYDPATGQYISSDPIGVSGGTRPHGYVHNPTTWVDPLGLMACSEDWKKYYAKQSGTEPPESMTNPHAHHIVFKGEFSRSPGMQAALGRSRAVLAKYDIDPVYDKDALMWAENQGHSITNAEAVATKLEAADKAISEENLPPDQATQQMKAALQRIGQEVFG
jgi:RHS repeat-associated protein